MKSFDFLRDRLADLAGQFPKVLVHSYFHPSIETHVVQIAPKEIFDMDDELGAAWAEIAMDFIENFPNEGISFVNEDDALSFNHIDQTNLPTEYFYKVGETPSVFEPFLQTNLNVSLDTIRKVFISHSVKETYYLSFFQNLSTHIGIEDPISITFLHESVIDATPALDFTFMSELAEECPEFSSDFALAA